MVRTVSNNIAAITELPETDDLWAALKDRCDPKGAGQTPYWIKNLFAIRPFKIRLGECLELLLKGMPEERLIAHCRELQRLRMCVKMAYIWDLFGGDPRGWRYSKKMDRALRTLDHDIDMHRLRIRLRARQISRDVEVAIAEIERDEPLGYPLWLPPPAEGSS